MKAPRNSPTGPMRGIAGLLSSARRGATARRPAPAATHTAKYTFPQKVRRRRLRSAGDTAAGAAGETRLSGMEDLLDGAPEETRNCNGQRQRRVVLSQWS